MSSPSVLLTRDGHISTLILNRPRYRNALNAEMVNRLHDLLNELINAEDIKVCILRGEGRAFCAGMDLKAVQHNPDLMGEMLRGLSNVLLLLRKLPMATIACVQRAAIGGGCGLATVCDFAITHKDSKVGYPEVDLGIAPAVVAPWLIRKLGAGKARAILLRGGIMSGDAAGRIGLFSETVESLEELDAAVSNLATELASAGTMALRKTKAWLNELDGSLDEKTARRGAEISADIIKSEETQKYLQKVFAEK